MQAFDNGKEWGWRERLKLKVLDLLNAEHDLIPTQHMVLCH